MKKIIYIAFGVCLFIVGCEDPLDKQPLDLISEKDVWSDEVLADSYIANLYDQARFFRGSNDDNIGMADVLNGGFARNYATWPTGYAHATSSITPDIGSAAVFHYWIYSDIRAMNEAIEKLSNESSELSKGYRDTRLGEVYFIRAWSYFVMVRLYGGVPLVDRVQDIDEAEEDLWIPRSSEEEVYDFVASDLDKAYNLLVGKNLNEYGRITEWAVLALKSRAMLYAASVGKFGMVQTIGSGDLQTTLGISDPDKYWKLSRDASKEIIDHGPFELYDNNADPAKNFVEIFDNEGHSEIILAEVFTGQGDRWNRWDQWMWPTQGRNGYSNFLKSFSHVLEKFEDKSGNFKLMNGSEFTLGDPSNRHSLDDFFYGDRDPRAQASFYLPEAMWNGDPIYVHQGTYDMDDTYKTGGGTLTHPVTGKTVPMKGLNRDINGSALNVRKKVRESHDLTVAPEGDSDYIVFRLAEIYLNYAEAELYVSSPNGDGLVYLNKVRQRVDMPDKPVLTQDIIRNERNVELMFEGHHFWDTRRWRTAEAELNGKNFQGLQFRYHLATDDYEIIKFNADNKARIFQPHYYYYPIRSTDINANPYLVQNPGYIE
ncbi:RagB/SusD family nutrient uptake outer membrane protein [Reichenbachiella sp. MALMAid0571]|uniref:RagB/SusD family nutrient uptake outer membrane protein n=1 Tax=Reichenbachiella sp. MALMAid0571 TaxID=3143939 RepID=UPI0032DF7BB1